MKAKLSVTLDESLISFVDSVTGATRSEKLETIVRRYREARRDAELRRELMAFLPGDDDNAEADAWRQVMESTQWSESGEATSGRSPSPRSRNRVRR